MKVIKEGVVGHWWIGRRIKCSCCLRVVELQEGDNLDPLCLMSTPGSVQMECAKCGTINILRHMDVVIDAKGVAG
jgi:LSD1 subclass zinc finger protein